MSSPHRLRLLDQLLNRPVGRRWRGAWPADALGLLERWYAAQPTARVAAVALEFEHPVEEGRLGAALEALRDRRSPRCAGAARAARPAAW